MARNQVAPRTVEASAIPSGAKAIVDRAINQSAKKRAGDAQGETPPQNISAQEAFAAAREERERRATAGQKPPSDPGLAGAPAVPDIEDLEELDDLEGPAASSADAQGIPAWVKVPDGFVFPDGWMIWFVRFPSECTNTAQKGDVHDPKDLDEKGNPRRYRQCILWALAEQDEKRGYRRAAGDGNRVVDEMAKAMIRAVDGHLANPAIERGDGSLAQFWSEIGGKCRHQLKSLYLKTHTMEANENARFFADCVAPRTVG